MNSIDTGILIITVLSCAFGLWRGLVKEVLSLLSWIAALMVARIYSEYLSGLMVNMIENESIRYVTAFAILFIVVMMLGTLLNHLISKLLTITGLKLADRVFGGVFGIARGVIIVLVIMFITSPFLSESPMWENSSLVPYGMDLIERSKIFIGDLSIMENTAT